MGQILSATWDASRGGATAFRTDSAALVLAQSFRRLQTPGGTRRGNPARQAQLVVLELFSRLCCGSAGSPPRQLQRVRNQTE